MSRRPSEVSLAVLAWALTDPGTVARYRQMIETVPAMAAERTVLQASLQGTTVLTRTLFGGSTPAAMRAEAQVWVNAGDTAYAAGVAIVARTNTYLAATATGALVNGFLIVEDLWLPELPPNDQWPVLAPVEGW